MATVEEKEQLIELLKHESRNVDFSMSGVGGEIVIGQLDTATCRFWKQQGSDQLADYATGRVSVAQQLSVPTPFKFIDPGTWYDCDDVAHGYGTEMCQSSILSVYDIDNSRLIFKCKMDPASLEQVGIQLVESQHVDVEHMLPGTAAFVGQESQPGSCYSVQTELTQPFDPSQLEISYSVYNGLMLAEALHYRNNHLFDLCQICVFGGDAKFQVLCNSNGTAW